MPLFPSHDHEQQEFSAVVESRNTQILEQPGDYIAGAPSVAPVHDMLVRALEQPNALDTGEGIAAVQLLFRQYNDANNGMSDHLGVPEEDRRTSSAVIQAAKQQVFGSEDSSQVYKNIKMAGNLFGNDVMKSIYLTDEGVRPYNIIATMEDEAYGVMAIRGLGRANENKTNLLKAEQIGDLKDSIVEEIKPFFNSTGRQGDITSSYAYNVVESLALEIMRQDNSKSIGSAVELAADKVINEQNDFFTNELGGTFRVRKVIGPDYAPVHLNTDMVNRGAEIISQALPYTDGLFVSGDKTMQQAYREGIQSSGIGYQTSQDDASAEFYDADGVPLRWSTGEKIVLPYVFMQQIGKSYG